MLEKQDFTDGNVLHEHFTLEPEVQIKEEKEFLEIPFSEATIKKEVEDAGEFGEVKQEVMECLEIKVEKEDFPEVDSDEGTLSEENCFTPDLVEKINQEARVIIRKRWSSLLNKDPFVSNDPTNPESLVCRKCHLNFKTKSDLLRHEENHADLPYQCTQCNMGFDREFSLKVHQATHGTLRRHKCEVCGKTFSRRTTLKDHALSHSGKKPYQCDVCKKYYRSKMSLRYHFRYHFQNKKYECPVCKKLFLQPSGLSEHLRMHRNAKDYKCDICGKHFSYQSTLKRHVKSHIRTEKHPCNQCGKLFRHNFSLLSHKRAVHLGLKPFKCEDCDKAFPRSRSLRLHMNSHRVLQVPNTIEIVEIVTREKDG